MDASISYPQLHRCMCNACKGRKELHMSTIRRHYFRFNNGYKITLTEILAASWDYEHRECERRTAQLSTPASESSTVMENELCTLIHGEATSPPLLYEEGGESSDFGADDNLDDAAEGTSWGVSLTLHADSKHAGNQHELDSQTTLLNILDDEIYAGSDQTLRQAIVNYTRIFIDKSLSKAAFSEMLRTTKMLLPTPNRLPASYHRVKSVIAEELVGLFKVHVCVNDCMIFHGHNSSLSSCKFCGECRYKAPDSLGRKYPRRIYSYTSVQQSLENMFGCANIAQVLQEAGGGTLLTPDIATDITQTKAWQDWTSGEPTETKVILALNTDGVNPYHSQGIQYSFWPIILCVMNLPKRIRNKADSLILVGVVPSRDQRKLGGSLEPNLDVFTDMLVDELLKLSSHHLHSAYLNAPLAVKVQLLLYMMDFQGYAKYFNMSGANAYFPCNVCTMKATRISTHSKMALIGHANYHAYPLRNYSNEVVHRETYDSLTNTSAKKDHAKALGIKGTYPAMRLPYHHRVNNTFIDGMHTIKDVVCNIMDCILGKKNFRISGLEISQQALKVADSKYLQLVIPGWIDLPKQSGMISHPRNLKSHDWKQLVHHRILQFTLQGLLPEQTEATLFELLDCISRLCTEQVIVDEWGDTVNRLVNAVALFEEKFPLLMNVTTHLLIHIAEQMEKYGPLHSTWLYAYERFNSWMSQRIKSRCSPEACIMETYVLHEWVARYSVNESLSEPAPDCQEYLLAGTVCLERANSEFMDCIPSAHSTDQPPVVSVSTALYITKNGRRILYNTDSIVLVDGSFFKIRKFVQLDDDCYAVGLKLHRRTESHSYFVRLIETSSLCFLPVGNLSRPSAYGKASSNEYFILNENV